MNSYRELFEKKLNPGTLRMLRLVSDEADSAKLPIHLVGGSVRDLILGHPVMDLDLVVEGDVLPLARELKRKYGGNLTEHSRFKTASWYPGEEILKDSSSGLRVIDLISSRSETYSHPGALPTVKRGTLKDDLRRRDFTINTLALSLQKDHYCELTDELGGFEDLRSGVVRALHPNSYLDDPTRILRAVRYEQRYGFRIAPEDLGRIHSARQLLGGLSGERVRHELDLVLEEPRRASMLGRLDALEILQEISPDLRWDPPLEKLLVGSDQPEPVFCKSIRDLPGISRRIALGYLLWLGRLSPGKLEDLASRLRMTAGLKNALLAATSLWADLPRLEGQKPSQATFLLEGYPVFVVCAISHALSINHASASVEKVLLEYLSTWRTVRPRTNGKTLLRLNLPPGPAYQVILNRLRVARLDGEIETVEEEEKLLNQLVTNL